MFDQSVKRMGFCCKYLDPDQSKPKRVLEDIQRQYTEKNTTVAWCNRQEKSQAEQRLLDIVTHNMHSALNLINWVGSLEPGKRMVRLGSNQVPMATEPTWGYLWKDPIVIKELEQGFAKIGAAAREHDVRISFHPGQFCVLASDKPDVVERSIDELEYHCDMVRWMGYGKYWQDMKVNVHISGRRGADGIIDVLPKLSPEARNTLTIENDEMCWGLDESLKLKDKVALVLDIHHHWIRDEKYVEPTEKVIDDVISSWRGIRPVIHFSYSRDEALPELRGSKHGSMHSIRQLIDLGCKKQKLRAHSDWYPNPSVNDWAISFWDKFDIQCESKMKNLARDQLYAQAVKNWVTSGHVPDPM